MNDYVINEDIRITLGNFCKEAREKRGIKLNQFCIKADIQPSLYSRFENGKVQKINPNLLIKIGNALRIDYKELYKIVGYLDEEDFQEAEKLKEEVADLKEKLQECENGMVIHHNHNNGNQILGSNLKDVSITTPSLAMTPEELDITELSEEKLQDLKKFIKYLKNS